MYTKGWQKGKTKYKIPGFIWKKKKKKKRARMEIILEHTFAFMSTGTVE